MITFDSLTIGQPVTLTRDIYEEPTGDTPGGYCGRRGETVVIRKINPRTFFPIFVSHPHRTDGATFGVKADEIAEAS